MRLLTLSIFHPGRMDDRRTRSLGDILDLLIADSLTDSCHMTQDHVTVVQGGKRHTFPHAKARTFLLGMLRGRSWNEGVNVEEEDVSPLRAVDIGRSVETVRHDPYEPALDELLRIATEMDIIEGSRRDRDANTVAISLSSCETELGGREAAAFLGECILHKLNQLRSVAARAVAPSSWEAGDGGWASTTQPLDQPSPSAG